MKKYLLGLFAVVLAVGFSAFTSKTTKKSNIDYYYFEVNSGFGSNSSFLNSELTWKEVAQQVDESVCLETASKKCIVGFTEDQVTHIGSGVYQINDNSGLLRQTPDLGAGMRFRTID